MAMDNLARAQAARDTGFQDRVRVAAVTLAIYVSATESSSATNHANRLALAKNVLNGQQSYAQLLALPVLTVGSLSGKNGYATSDISDAELQAAMETIWDGVAGKA